MSGGDISRLGADVKVTVADPPTLRDKYSGIPERLLEKARNAKRLVYQNQTKKASDRIRLPVVPLGLSQPTFNSAIGELRAQIGDANVVINDQPLDDGW